MTKFTIGVDISKSTLDVFRLEDGALNQFANSPVGFKALIKWLGDLPIKRIVFEPTGSYHRAFEKTFGGTFPMVKVNPLQARRFAQASGTRAKTDAVDARGLAAMGAALNLRPQNPISENERILKDFHVARASLIKERSRLRNRLQTQTIPLLKRQSRARLTQVERQIIELDAAIAAIIGQEEGMARQRDILCSIPGLGPVTSAALLTLLPELGTLDRKKVASLAGLAPFSRQSGRWQGKTFIGGGRKPLRDALYMPALVAAARFNPDLKSKYEQLRAAGKPAKVAIVAVMRKLLETANALIKADRFWAKKTDCA